MQPRCKCRLITLGKSTPRLGGVVLDLRIEKSLVPMHVHHEPTEIQNLACMHREAAKARGLASCINSRTDGRWAAADVDLLDNIGPRFHSEDVRHTIIIGAAEHAFPIGRHRATDSKIIVIVGAVTVPLNLAKKHIANVRGIAQWG